MKAVIHTDGASKGNPGEAGIGIVITINGKTYEISKYIGRTTNNVAEYKALTIALKETRELKADIVEIYMDSELIVKQIMGIYKVKTEHLYPLYSEVRNLLSEFRDYTIQHIPRKENKRADSLANKAITNRAD